MPFVLLHLNVEIAQAPTADGFVYIGLDERVEFRSNGAAWDEIDRLKDEAAKSARAREAEKKKARRQELGNRIVFAITKAWRFTAHRDGADVVAYPADKKVGSVGGLREKRKRKVTQLQELGDRGEWCDVRASDLLVALDEWREAGCPRRVWKRLDWEKA